jgi:DNA-binding transcriptional regulator GbsR (MarR family)
MNLQEAKDLFIQSWGNFGSNWGINKTMAQVHALLLVTENPISTEDIMSHLDISRGNANMNIRTLIEWGLVSKDIINGTRKEYFVAEKDILIVVKQIIVNRKKKELEPTIKILGDVQKIEGESPEKDNFLRMIQEIEHFSRKADLLLDKLIEADANWILSSFLKMI